MGEACGAAFLLRVHDKGNRIQRIYYQSVGTGDWAIVNGSTKKPAFNVLANRETTYTAPGVSCP